MNHVHGEQAKAHNLVRLGLGEAERHGFAHSSQSNML